MAKQGCFAVVLDMFPYQDPAHETVVEGFPTFASAKDYARRRTRDSLEELRTENQNAEELRRLWFAFGEDVLAFGPDAEERYHGSSELDFFIVNLASTDERDWPAVERQTGARTRPGRVRRSARD